MFAYNEECTKLARRKVNLLIKLLKCGETPELNAELAQLDIDYAKILTEWEACLLNNEG